MPFKDPDKRREYFREYYRKKRLEAIHMLGGCCVECGESCDLEFDHIKPIDKKFEIAKLMSYKWSEVVEEVKKCQLLCRSCHEDKTERESDKQKRYEYDEGKRRTAEVGASAPF